MNIDSHAYNISIRRDVFDGEVLFEARIKELPDLIEFGETYEEAYELAVDSIQTTAEIFAEKGRAFPQPGVPADDFSGRVTLRLPRSLHRALAQAADEEGVSLNQHMTNVLTYHSGFATGYKLAADTAWISAQNPVTTRTHQSNPHLKVIHGASNEATWNKPLSHMRRIR